MSEEELYFAGELVAAPVERVPESGKLENTVLSMLSGAFMGALWTNIGPVVKYRQENDPRPIEEYNFEGYNPLVAEVSTGISIGTLGTIAVTAAMEGRYRNLAMIVGLNVAAGLYILAKKHVDARSETFET